MRPSAGLYAILDPSHTRGRDPRVIADAILAGGCARLQLRAKDLGAGALVTLARELAPRCRAAGVPLVINDRPDVARVVGADGVHLGRDDLPVSDARALLGAAFEIGRSTHTPAEARDLAGAGVDLIAFGPLFETSSKPDAEPVVGLEALREVCRAASHPVVAIGGLTLENAPSVREAGAHFGAAISAVCGAQDPRAAAAALHAALGGQPPSASERT